MYMRAHEFITEYIDDLHTTIMVAKKSIMDKISSGEIPNNPDSIKSASKQLAMDMRDIAADLDPEMISREIENQISIDRIAKNAHLGGRVNIN